MPTTQVKTGPNTTQMNEKPPLLEKQTSLRREFGLYKAEEVAGIVGVTPFALSKWRSRGEGPAFFRLGKQYFYKKDDIDAWINAAYASKNPPVPTDGS